MPTTVSRLRRRYPKLKFQVTQAPTIAAFYGDLRDRNVDLILGRILAPIADHDLTIDMLFDEPLLVVVGSKSPWLRRRQIELAALIDEPWMLPPAGSVGAAIIQETFYACGLQFPQTHLICDSSQMYAALLATEPYVAMLPRSLVLFSGKRLGIHILPVKLPRLPRPVGIITLKGRTVSPAAGLFIDCAHEVGKSLESNYR